MSLNKNITEIRPYRHINRRKSKQIMVGNVAVGGDAPITVQSMTNTLTTDIQGTIRQVMECVEAGADLMRISIPDKESSEALKQIIPHCPVPIIADIHFHYRRAIEAAEAGAKCLRINPGNIGSDEKVKEVIRAAKDYGCSIRIGVNAGSLEQDLLDKYKTPTPEALVESALRHIRILEDNDFFETKISVKASDAMLAIASYKQLAEVCDYPLHIGITESGGLMSGSVRSSIGLGNLLFNGIGDTMRVSLSAPPVEEVKVAYNILKSLGLRSRGVNIISCPSCARQGFDVVKTVEAVEKRVEHIKTSFDVSILGCVVNGLGEAAHTTIGITGGGNNRHNVYLNGKPDHKMDSANLVDHIVELIEKEAERLSGK
ncbi:MAG: 1-hydroxy-2-methyl-2-(E)-butenyl 4-diphosphate synthase [Rickettsiaceae bacterium]|jgi:(E)-4-hydroxy-3-methylbut-2-enyl-diphosphate synthase|nr:1-hydroxy-2-methyl-2-(E)-butenyl 4-diphosphate synthase [Rickettsiaceae bacterium]